jgi:hypothetical protein
MTEIAKPSELMTKASLQWLELTLSLPDGPQRFQNALIEAGKVEPKSKADVENLIGLAHAAVIVSESDAQFAPWYREYVQRLLCSAFDGVAMIEANAQRQAAALN